MVPGVHYREIILDREVGSELLCQGWTGSKGKGGGEGKGDEGQADRGSSCFSGLGGEGGCCRGVKDQGGQGRAQPR